MGMRLGTPLATAGQIKAINRFFNRFPSYKQKGDWGYYSSGVCVVDFTCDVDGHTEVEKVKFKPCGDIALRF